MKCKYCGADLGYDVLFCRECGHRIEHTQKKFCRECGGELLDGASFCSICGAHVGISSKSMVGEDGNTADKTKKKGKLDTASKAADKSKSMLLVFSSFALIIIIGIWVYIFCTELFASEKRVQTANNGNMNSSELETMYSIDKGSEYSFMSDEWNVYIAVAVSDSIVKIEHWNKSLSSTTQLHFSSDIGSFKINDSKYAFAWLDDSHTAFSFVFSDNNNSRVKKAKSHIFTINTNSDSKFKGTNYDHRIACYTYTNDDWHMYRAIPLTENLIKIECWSRTLSLPWNSFCYGWDWCIIDVNNSDAEFEWTDEDRTSFSIISQDTANKAYWKKPSFVVFELENEEHKYGSVKDYLVSREE